MEETGWINGGQAADSQTWKGLFDMLYGDFIAESHSYILWPTLLHPSEIHKSPMAKRQPAESAAGCQVPSSGTCTAVGLPHGPLARSFALWFLFLPQLSHGLLVRVSHWV